MIMQNNSVLERFYINDFHRQNSMGAVNTAAWIVLVWKRERKLWVNLALLLVLFASFNTQNLIADVFFWLFPVMAVVERVLPGRQTAQET